MNQALVLKFNNDHIRYRDQAFNINIFRTKVPIYDQFKKVNTKYLNLILNTMIHRIQN